MSNIASETALADALRKEATHCAVAIRVANEVLVDARADDEVRSASIKLIEWLSRPAEHLVRRK